MLVTFPDIAESMIVVLLHQRAAGGDQEPLLQQERADGARINPVRGQCFTVRAA